MAFNANDQALQRLGGMSGRFRSSLGQAADMAGKMLVRASQTGQKDGPKSGVIYGSHKASAPGEYSAPISFDLHDSTAYEASAAQIRFGVGVEHGLYQEMGTSKMAPRPNLGNAVEECQDEMNRLLGEFTFRRMMGGG
jgi:hypothetical protein